MNLNKKTKIFTQLNVFQNVVWKNLFKPEWVKRYHYYYLSMSAIIVESAFIHHAFAIHTIIKNTYTEWGLLNILRPRQNGRYFADDIFKCIFLNVNAWISLKISLKFVPRVRINNIPSLIQIIAWRRPGDKPLSEPMMVSLLTHICVTRPQWVKMHNTLWFRRNTLSFIHSKRHIFTLKGEIWGVFCEFKIWCMFSPQHRCVQYHGMYVVHY